MTAGTLGRAELHSRYDRNAGAESGVLAGDEKSGNLGW